LNLRYSSPLSSLPSSSLCLNSTPCLFLIQEGLFDRTNALGTLATQIVDFHKPLTCCFLPFTVTVAVGSHFSLSIHRIRVARCRSCLDLRVASCLTALRCCGTLRHHFTHTKRPHSSSFPTSLNLRG